MVTREQYEANKAKAEKQQQDKHPLRPWHLGQRDPIARFTLYVAFFTLALVIVGYLQFCILHKADETSRLRDRAFVSVDGIDIRPQKKGEAVVNWRLDPIITNNGATPTRDMTISVVETHFPDYMRHFLELPGMQSEPYDPKIFVGKPMVGNMDPQLATLGPKQTYKTKGFWLPSSMVEKKAAAPFKYRMFLMGVINYRDIYEDDLDQDRITEFCYEIAIDATIENPVTPMYFQCPRWNCADDECKKQKTGDPLPN